MIPICIFWLKCGFIIGTDLEFWEEIVFVSNYDFSGEFLFERPLTGILFTSCLCTLNVIVTVLFEFLFVFLALLFENLLILSAKAQLVEPQLVNVAFLIEDNILDMNEFL